MALRGLRCLQLKTSHVSDGHICSEVPPSPPDKDPCDYVKNLGPPPHLKILNLIPTANSPSIV